MADDSGHDPGAQDRLPASPARTVVFALYNKVTLQDVAAPLEIFARANDFGANYTVLLSSPTGEAVGTTAFATLNVDIPLAEVPDCIDTLRRAGRRSGRLHLHPRPARHPGGADTRCRTRCAEDGARTRAAVAAGRVGVYRRVRARGTRAAGRTSRDHPLGTLPGTGPRLSEGDGRPGLSVRQGRPVHHRRRDHRRHRPGACLGRERLRPGGGAPGGALDGGLPPASRRAGPVQRVGRVGAPDWRWAPRDRELRDRRSRCRPLDRVDGGTGRGERAPPGADVPGSGRA